jgi:hypothetical protein
MDTQRWERLPLWAQSELQRLQHNTEALERKIEGFTTAEKTNTVLIDLMDERGLPDNSLIRFKLDTGGQVDVRTTGRFVDIHGSRAVSIFPRDANVIRIELEGRE